MLESKLLKLFKLLLGNKYKIVPVRNKGRGRKISKSTVKENPDNMADSVSDSLAEDSMNTANDPRDSSHTDGLDSEDDSHIVNEDYVGISAEAIALFERDKRKYGINTSKPSESLEDLSDDSKEIIKKAQAAYDRAVNHLSKRIEMLEMSKETAREYYLDILKNNDNDDPYRAQLADHHNPIYIKEQIGYYKKVKQDPFYGRFRLLSRDGKIIDAYIGRIAFEEGNIMIVSPWSEIGKAFRQNRSSFSVRGNHYSVLNKYTYISKNGKITGVKDDSPR